MVPVLDKKNILTGCPKESPEDAIRRCGRMLLSSGYVKEAYIDGMLARERSFSTAIGNAIAIPHGEMEFKKEILHTGLAVCTYPDGIDWHGDNVNLVIGIAANGDEHLSVLERIAEAFEDERTVAAVVSKGDVDDIYSILMAEETGT